MMPMDTTQVAELREALRAALVAHALALGESRPDFETRHGDLTPTHKQRKLK
jgi:hypothetical protein